MDSTSASPPLHESVASPAEEQSIPPPTQLTGDQSTGIINYGKKRKPMAPRSSVWLSFKMVVDKNGDPKAKCNNCNKLLSCGSKINDTSSLRAHVVSCQQRANAESSQTELILNAGGDVGGQGGMQIYKYDENAVRKALAYMIVVDELPFKFVEKEGFRHFISVLNPRFRLPSRFTITRDIFQQFLDEKEVLKQFLKMDQQRVSLTTDTWTSVQNMSYMSLTAHYIDKEWVLHKKILKFSTITSHKGEDIGKAVENWLLEWGINKVFIVTVDNASANDTAIEYLKRKIKNWKNSMLDCKWLHMRCVAHIINLIVVDGLKQPEAQDAVKKIRFAVKHIKKSPQRLATFKQCVERAKIQSKAQLTLDVPTRWNSTYLMLVAAEKLEKAFEIYAEEDRRFIDELLELGSGFLVEDDWITARRLIIFLEKFFDVTKKVSGSLYVTSNMFFDEIYMIIETLEEWCQSDDILFKSMAVHMKEKYEKYWGDIDKMNMLIYIACILDPKARLNYVEFMITDTYESDVERGRKFCKHLKESLFEMFDWYEAKMKPVGTSNNEATSLNMSSASGCESQGGGKAVVSKRKMKWETLMGTNENLSDLERYLKEEPYKGDLDVLKWWKVNSEEYPVLSEMARDVLAVPISTVASESAFSTAGRVLDDFRSSLTPKMVETLICGQNWIRKKFDLIGVEEGEEDIHELAREMAKCSIALTVLGENNDVDMTDA